MPSSSPRILCFDLGGVIVRICRTWGQACARAGLPERDPARFNRSDLAAQRKHAVDLYQTGRIRCAEFWNMVAGATDGLYSPADIQLIHTSWIIEDYPGIAPLINKLNALPGITTACLSNTNHAHWLGMTGVGPGHSSPAVRAIRHHGVSHLMNAAKPGPEIYRKAEAAMGAVPAEILFFDDLGENIAAARQLGWNAVQIDHEADTAAQIRRACESVGIVSK